MTAAAYVTLKPGLTIPLAAARLALDLECRGLELTVDGDAVAIVGPPHLVTDEDRAGVSRWQPQLAALVRYVDAQEHEQ